MQCMLIDLRSDHRWLDFIAAPPEHGLLEFSHGNAKLPNSTMLLSLPAGHTCPGANACLTFADRITGRITDGPNAEFRCYAALAETRPTVRELRWRNLRRLTGRDADAIRDLLVASVLSSTRAYSKRVRLFESGDCFSPALRDGILSAAAILHHLVIYFYTKNLPLWLDRRGDPLRLPPNLFITASWGGKHDQLIEQGLFPRNSRVVFDEEEANRLGLPIDHTDELAYDASPQAFAHLLHGVPKKGTPAAEAIRRRRRLGQFTGYGRHPIPLAS